MYIQMWSICEIVLNKPRLNLYCFAIALNGIILSQD